MNVRKILFPNILILLFLSISTRVNAITDPISVPNNHYGIHITNDEDIDAAALLVNSQGGDWGYVTFVIRADDRDVSKWQGTFDKLREKHLIPIVRLATTFNGDSWNKPLEHEVGDWVEFLNSLNWVVRNRYVILFNEPNHNKEWGGSSNAQEYAQILASFHLHLKAASDDFFILPAGLDAAAPNGIDTISFASFTRSMHAHNPDIFSLIDGWNSHSYPNPDFTSSPYNNGLKSIRSYTSELYMLRQYGVDRDIPIFITETGWKHNQDNSQNDGLLPATVNRYYDIAFSSIWNDPNIIAITPFILNYQDEPFTQFSWQKKNGTSFYPWYETIKNHSKTAGSPEQYHQAIPIRIYLPEELTTNHQYQSTIRVLNLGQSIWSPNSVTPAVDSNDHQLQFSIGSNSIEVKPMESVNIPIMIYPDQKIIDHTISWHLNYQENKISPNHTFIVSIKPPNVVTALKVWLYRSVHQENFIVY